MPEIKRNKQKHKRHATGIEDAHSDRVQGAKVFINGTLYILRGEHMYDAQGKMVK